MSQPTPSFVTQVQRPDNNQNKPTNATQPVATDTVTRNDSVDDDEVGCCPCLFGTSKRKSSPQPQNNNNNKPQQTVANNGAPVISKIQISTSDRDQIGVNSPRGVDARPKYMKPSGSKISLLGPQLQGREGRKCLVLDLDETLVHSSFQPVDKYDFLIPVEIEGNVYQVYVAKRPHVDEFLKKMGEVYEVVIFTASLSKYADPVLDLLDIHKVIDYRLFREHCTCINDIYVKDMSILGRPIESVFIIDNSPHAYSLQPENAFPCTSWFDDYEDNELLEFIPVLQDIAKPSVKNIITELDRLKLNGCGKLDSFSQYTSDETSEDST
jgi:carboxy-terminal domain RNA polymerase II polypeptide A small phosphatase